MARAGFWGSLALLVLVAAGGGFWAAPVYLQGAGLAPGVRVAGARLESPELEARLHALARELESEPVELVLPAAGIEPGGSSQVVRASLLELGVSVDVEAMVRRARSIGRRGSLVSRVRELERVRESGVDVPVALAQDREALFKRLAAAKHAIDRPPLPARYDSQARALISHVPGRYVDLERAADLLWALANARATTLGSGEQAQPGARIELGLVSIAPRINRELLGEFEPREVVSQFSTRFRSSGDYRTRAANIAVAASRLDGLILMPGDRISFNDVVGERSVANGFQDSWQLMEGEFVRGVGGGTCQVSSTLHAAALHAGLDIVEAYPHSRPLAYIGKGLDATVAWPFVDLKLQNPWPTPLAISALVQGGTLTFRFLAEALPAKVRVRSEIKETLPFPRVVEVGFGVASSSYERKQEGIPGYVIERTRFIAPSGGEPRREVHTKRYRPTPELYRVAPDFDVAELPPLPEGAEGYESSPEDVQAWDERDGPLG